MRWEIVAQTNVGKVRKKNEDAHLILKAIPLMLVADGMGGMYAGEVASGKIVERLATLTDRKDGVDLEAATTRALQRAHQEILSYSHDKLEGGRAGSTVVVLALEGCAGFCLWVGDSRLYRVRENEIAQLTSDHSQVNEMLKQGIITEDQAKAASYRNVLTHAVGVQEDFYWDRIDIDSKPGDTYLLCSDGLYNEIDDHELQQILSGNDIYRISVQLANLCLRRGARDNFTFVICRSTDRVVTQSHSDATEISDSDTEYTQMLGQDGVS